MTWNLFLTTLNYNIRGAKKVNCKKIPRRARVFFRIVIVIAVIVFDYRARKNVLALGNPGGCRHVLF